jgi:DNA-binding beta-propeller fold protein YncE
VAGNNINQVVGINENGVEIANFGRQFDENPPPSDEARAINRPMGLASDSLGGIWVANSGVIDIACGYQILEGEKLIDGEDSTYTSLQNAGILDEEGNATNTYDGELASIAYIRQDDGGTYILDQYTGGGVIVPWGVALDGNDNVWIANFDGQRVSLLCGPRTETCPAGSREVGAPISPDGGYYFAGLVRNTGLSIDPSGNVWLANNWLQDPVQTNPGGREVVVFLGMAKPVITPLLGYPRAP